MKRKLILFDIDGTLVLDDGAARESFRIALEDVYAYSGNLRSYDFSGRTDPEIAHMVLADTGLSDETIFASIPRLWDRYLHELASRATSRSVRILAGVKKLLDLLSTRDDIIMGLLTGNIEPGARIKLESHRLNGYFPFGAFGSDSIHREELPPFAVQRASDLCGHQFAGRDVVIIGDSIYDVRCGAPHEATTIAVASGRTSAETLAAENPDLLIESLENMEELLGILDSA